MNPVAPVSRIAASAASVGGVDEAAGLRSGRGDGTRDRLADGVYTASTPNNPAGRIIAYLPKVVLAEPVERKFLKALKNSDISALEFDAQLDEGVREGSVARDMVIAMLIIFVFNVLFWMFFEQAGSSFTFLAEKIVNKQIGSFTFPIEWFQSINAIAIILLAPLFAWLWIRLGRANPSIPRKFGLGLIFNGVAFAVLMFALTNLLDDKNMIPLWTQLDELMPPTPASAADPDPAPASARSPVTNHSPRRTSAVSSGRCQ